MEISDQKLLWFLTKFCGENMAVLRHYGRIIFVTSKSPCIYCNEIWILKIFTCEMCESVRERHRQRCDVVITMVYVRWSIITQFSLTKTTLSSFQKFAADRNVRFPLTKPKQSVHIVIHTQPQNKVHLEKSKWTEPKRYTVATRIKLFAQSSASDKECTQHYACSFSCFKSSVYQQKPKKKLHCFQGFFFCLKWWQHQCAPLIHTESSSFFFL